MPLAEGVSASVRYKSYATGVITANSQPVSTVDPAVTGGQILRRVSSTIKLGKDTYQSAEIRTDRQIADFRHGIKRVTGGVVSGEFSPGTYFDFFEAALRATKVAAVTATEADFTSAAFDNTLSQVTFGGGAPVTKGFRVGDIIQFTNIATAGNNSSNFVILAFSGTSNRVLTVYPAPITAAADTAFSVAQVGKTVFMPSSVFVSRKFAIEHYFADLDISRLFTEVRIDGFNVQLPATGMATVDFPGIGRDMEIYTGAAAPFFSAPTAEGTTGIFAAVNGLLMVAGSAVGVVTGLNIQMALSGSGDAVVGQNFVPEIFLGRANVTGQFTALLQDATFLNYFKNESEISILAYLTASSAVNAPAATIYLPRVKLGDADAPLQGEGGVVITCPFQALKGPGTVAGDEATTIRIADSQAV